MDYTYFRINPKTPAAEALEAMEKSVQVAHDFATKFGKKYLKKVPFAVVSSDNSHTPVGFCPKEGQTWNAFMQAIDAKIWSREERGALRWVRPAKTPAAKKDSSMREDWEKRPHGIPWRDVTRQLVGLSDFNHGMRGYGACLQTYNGTKVMGVPYPVTVGKMGSIFDSGTFQLLAGVEPIPHDEAMRLIYADFGKKAD